MSKKSKVRIAALEAYGSVLLCGVWKYNAVVFEILIGFRDPNSVPLKDFYSPSYNINYLATLINDPKPAVREMFLRQVGDWISILPDRYDHHGRLVPYVLSGLFDSEREIRDACYEIIEEVGLLHEREKEKELRDQKQYAIDSEWHTCAKQDLWFPDPIVKRPRLGARLFIRSHVRKFWHALYKEVQDHLIGRQIFVNGRKQSQSVQLAARERRLRRGLYDAVFGPLYQEFGLAHRARWQGKLKSRGEYSARVLFDWEILRFPFLSTDYSGRAEGGTGSAGGVCEGLL